MDLSGSCDDELVFFGEIINTQNGNDILEGFIILEDLLDASCDVVMLLTNGDGVKHSGSRIEGIDGRVNTKLSETSVKHSSCVQVSECSGWSGIGEIISWNVNSLDGGNGTLLSGGNSFLEGTEIGS